MVDIAELSILTANVLGNLETGNITEAFFLDDVALLQFMCECARHCDRRSLPSYPTLPSEGIRFAVKEVPVRKFSASAGGSPNGRNLRFLARADLDILGGVAC